MQDVGTQGPTKVTGSEERKKEGGKNTVNSGHFFLFATCKGSTHTLLGARDGQIHQKTMLKGK